MSPTNCVFRPNARKFNAWFCNFFAKQAIIQQFLQLSSGIFCKFSKIFKIFSTFSQPIVFFVQTRENLTRGFVISLQNRRKYSIFCNFLQEFFCKFSKILRRPGGSAPRTPYEAGSPTLTPPKFFPAYATDLKRI